ncbi:MAG TPA: L-aspartate oxidase [Ktedonobacterales bacterium]|nr:L-aspartate oxidase [Ktedonobacterales bacterium]
MFFDRPEGGAEQHADVAIIGGGVAGLTLALSLPSSLRIALLTKGALGESNTRYAQGGLAAAVGSDDSPELHLRDTLIAGAGLCDETAVRLLVEQAPDAVRWLIAIGAQFDRKEVQKSQKIQESAQSSAIHPSGATSTSFEAYLMGHEAAHSRRRVLHAHGDATGAEIERALVAAVRSRKNTTIYERTFAQELIVRDGQCCGVLALDHSGRAFQLQARATVLANGGAGRLWLRTSNPPLATADGLALAWGAGAALADLEFTQFHPTVLVTGDGNGSAFLISEAVRGEGAYLRNQAGERFMARYHPDAELAPRDVVARAILSEMLREGVSHAYLDLRHLPAEAMRARFPSIAAFCAQHGMDLASDLIPVAPAAHYFMGGVAVDSWGRTTLPQLYAVGEVACTGVHGANRLASNSLLEGLVFGRRAARAIAQESPDAWPEAADVFSGQGSSRQILSTAVAGTSSLHPGIQGALRRIMWEHVSLYRDEQGLRQASLAVKRLIEEAATHEGSNGSRPIADSAPFTAYETASMVQIAQLIITAALQRRESRGSHYRNDYPATDPALAGRHTLLLNAALGHHEREPARIREASHV